MWAVVGRGASLLGSSLICLLPQSAVTNVTSPAAVYALLSYSKFCFTLPLARHHCLHLQAMEERQRQLRSDAAPLRLTTQHIYNTVNSQMAIIQTQAGRRYAAFASVSCFLLFLSLLPSALA